MLDEFPSSFSVVCSFAAPPSVDTPLSSSPNRTASLATTVALSGDRVLVFSPDAEHDFDFAAPRQ